MNHDSLPWQAPSVDILAATADTRTLFFPETECHCRLAAGLRLLLDAIEYAADLRILPDEFAVEGQTLSFTGLLPIDLRWLLRKDYVRHWGVLPGAFPIDSFFLTPAGIDAARELLGRRPVTPAEVAEPLLPTWDGARRELRWAERLVKRFRVPAPNQQLVLTAFHEEGWPAHIDDPLPMVATVEPKRRLHDTITALNRHRLEPAVRFSGDGTGTGIRWETEPRKSRTP